MKRKLFSFSALFIAITLIGINAHAKNSKNDLQKVKKEIATTKANQKKLDLKSKQIQKEMMLTQQKMIRLANNIQENESKLSNLDDNLKELRTNERFLNDTIIQKQNKITEIMANLQWLALTPPGIIMSTSKDVGNLENAAMLMQGNIEIIEHEISQFHNEIEELDKTSQQIERKKRIHIETTNKIARQKKDMEKLLTTQKSQRSKIEEEKALTSEKLKNLAKKSKSISDFLRRAEEERRRKEKAKAKKSKKYKTYKGSAPKLTKVESPSRGRVILNYGERNKNGVISEGLTLKTQSNATVTSPYDGEVLFTGYFKGFEKVIIIEHAQGFHSVLTHLGSIYVNEGQKVRKAEPVSTTNSEGKFYLELRYKNEPVDPLNYFIVKQ